MLATSIFIAVFQTLTFFVFVTGVRLSGCRLMSVHRFGEVLEYYAQAINLLRGRRAELAGVDEPFATFLNARDNPALPPMGKWFSVQGTAERILVASLVLGGVASLGAALVAVIALEWPWPGSLAVVMSAGCLASAAWCAITSLIAIRSRRGPFVPL